MLERFPLSGALTLMLAAGLMAQSRRPVDLEAADCARHNMSFGDLVVARAVQHATVPLSGGRLDIEPETNGGVEIEPGSGSSYSITACIGAGASTYAQAQAAADAIRLSIEGRRVRVSGARAAHSWSVHLIVESPDGADIGATTTNGPIGIANVSGKFDARATNGPVGLRNVRGTVSARVQNGPVSVEGSRGEFDLETANGPISIVLTGSRWEGRLDARAQNGPLDVEVPADYRSGVEISSSFNSPWNCRAAACRGSGRDWDERSRNLRIGPEPIVVRISTVNGPVTIADR